MPVSTNQQDSSPAAINPVGRVGRLLLQKGPGIGLEVLFNFLLPFLAYSACEPRLGAARSLMVAAAPPLLWGLFEFVRRRRIDALSMLVLAGVGLSILAYLGGGSIRILQLREKLVTAFVGLVFLISAASGHPLMYQLGRATVGRGNPAKLSEFEAMKSNARFRRTMTTLTLVWGSALLLEAAVATLLVFRFTVRQYLVVGPVLGYATMGAVGFWSFLYVRKQRPKRSVSGNPVRNGVESDTRGVEGS